MQPKQQSSSAGNFVHVPTDRFREVCLRNGGENCKETMTILENLFNPEKSFDESNCNVDILKSYITGGVNYDTFKTKLKSYDTSSVCGLVWNVNYIAYRCRTCALSPCMSICADCFKNGDHEGHDYNMFRSGAGGACDCGDDHVMNPNGFCKNHGCNKKSASSSPPQELIKCSEVVLPNLLYRILQHFRSSYMTIAKKTELGQNSKEKVITDIASYIDFLNDLCSIGTPLRKIFVDHLISEEYYKHKIELEKQKQSESLKNEHELTYQQEVYLKSLKEQKSIEVPEVFSDKKTEICQLDHNKMVDEFLFWCIKFELPENLVKFLLSLLTDPEYKKIFVKSFVTQYSYILTMLIESKLENFSSRVVHISVQLFSDEAIAVKAMKEFNLFPIFLSTIHNIISNTNVKNLDKKLLIKNSLQSSANTHLVVDPDHPILQENLYWLPISDLSNLLSHKSIATEFLLNQKIIKLWIDLVTYFQSMNLNVRQFSEHLQYESPTYFSSFSAELEFCSSIMWSLLQHMSNVENATLSIKLLQLIIEKLISWLSQITLMDLNKCERTVIRPNPKHLSFHLPLHRYFSCFLYNTLTMQKISLDQVMADIFTFDSDTNQYCMGNILAHPLQLLIGSCEIHANMWTRNGLQMKGQVMTYVQNHFCSSFSDLDLFLVQVLASQLDPDNFMNMFLERFHILAWLKNSIKNRTRTVDHSSINNKSDSVHNLVETMLNNLSQNSDEDEKYDELESAHINSMIIGSLTLLAQIMTIRPNLSLKSYSLTRKEIVNLLSISDRTYSQTEESLPDVCSLSSGKKFIKQILSEVSDYLQPSLDILSIGNLKQGRYKPKDSIWLNEYDPLFVVLRSVKMREFQESFDRYCQFLEKKIPKKKFWPPFQLPEKEKISSATADSEMKKESEIESKLEQDLSKRKNLLNTKILHAILLNLLYEHLYINPLAEKTLYFVIFILELSVHETKINSEQKMEVDSESNINQVVFDEKNPTTWFKTNKIEHNLHTFVSFSQVEKNLVKLETPIEAMSGNKSLPPLKRICSGLSPTSSRPPTPIVPAETEFTSTEKSCVHESIISLLVKILHRNKSLDEKIDNKSELFKIEYHQDTQDPFSFKNSRVGDENDYLINLLEKISKLNDKCRLNIEKTIESINAPKQALIDKLTSSPGTSNSTEDDLKMKKLKAKARQQKLLAQMSSSQKAFLSNPSNKNDIEAYKASEKGTNIATEKSENLENISNKTDEFSADKSTILTDDQDIDCCICQLSANSAPDRPLGVVALLQATNVLGNRESINLENPVKNLITDSSNESDNESSDSLCWKREKNRVKNMMEAFKPESCKYSVNIGWQGGVYAQMCGHYLHFDCYSSYRQALDEQIHGHRINHIDFACPLCRQTANCVLPLTTNFPTKVDQLKKQNTDVVVSSTVSNVPAKIWILSSLADKMNMDEESKSSEESGSSSSEDIYEKILTLLKFRSFLGTNSCSKTLAQFKNDALTIITLSTPIEFRHLEHKSNLFGHHSYGFKSPVDDDIVMFTTSVLRTQLEIDLMLLLKKQNLKITEEMVFINSEPCSSTNSDNYLSANKFNFKKKKMCFLPLLDVISTHCRLMCHETKPHAKQWLMLTNPSMSKNTNKFLFKIGVKSNIDNTMEFFESESTSHGGSNFSNLKDSHQSILQSRLNNLDKLEVPVLLKDPIAVLLLIVVNLPYNFDKTEYNVIVSVVFNMVFIQAILDFVKELDAEEKEIWSKNTDKQVSEYSKYVGHVIKYAGETKFLKKLIEKPLVEKTQFFMKKIWTPESAKNFIETKCIHFLNIASLLKFYLYDENSSIFKNLTNNFDNLIHYLDIAEPGKLVLKWPSQQSYETFDFWLDELDKSYEQSNFQIQNLLNLSFDRYHFPQLVKLPHSYSDLFNRYLNKKCKFCSKVPKELAVCLVCGNELCFKCNFCCDMMRDSNKKHTNLCGAGTLILLHINSTYVFIERNKRSAVWASLYLDEHGEEDKDLKRGKPLFLNEQRYNLLKSSWYSHTFDYQSLKWSYNPLLNY